MTDPKVTAAEMMEPTGCAVCGAALTQEHVGSHDKKKVTAEEHICPYCGMPVKDGEFRFHKAVKHGK